MGHTILLHRGHNLQTEVIGVIVFHSLLIQDTRDFVCVPPEVVSTEQVEAIASELRHLPQVNAGTVGEFCWRLA